MASSVVRDEITILQLCDNDGVWAVYLAWFLLQHLCKHSCHTLGLIIIINIVFIVIISYTVIIINSTCCKRITQRYSQHNHFLDENCEILPPLNSQTRPTHP